MSIPRLLALSALALTVAACDTADPVEPDTSVFEGTYALSTGETGTFRTTGRATITEVSRGTYGTVFGISSDLSEPDANGIQVRVGFGQSWASAPIPGTYPTDWDLDNPGEYTVDGGFLLTNVPGLDIANTNDPSLAQVTETVGEMTYFDYLSEVRGTFRMTGEVDRAPGLTITVEGRFEVPIVRR